MKFTKSYFGFINFVYNFANLSNSSLYTIAGRSSEKGFVDITKSSKSPGEVRDRE